MHLLSSLSQFQKALLTQILLSWLLRVPPRSTLINEEIIKSITLNSTSPYTGPFTTEGRGRERRRKKNTGLLIDELDLFFPDNKFHLFYKNYAQVTLFDGIFITCRVNKSNLCCLILSRAYKSQLYHTLSNGALMKKWTPGQADCVVTATVAREAPSLSMLLYGQMINGASFPVHWRSGKYISGINNQACIVKNVKKKTVFLGEVLMNTQVCRVHKLHPEVIQSYRYKRYNVRW